jgi:hypothetical protein
VTSFVFLCSLLINQPSEEITYGEVYLQETGALKLPRFSFSVGYAKDLNHNYLNLNSISLNAQYRLWKYWSAGVFGQWMHSSLTENGKELRNLRDTADLIFDTSRPNYGIFALTELQFMIGKWNILNSLAIQVEVLLGLGGGLLNRDKGLELDDENIASYLWIVEQRVRFYENFGVYVSFFAHRDAAFVSPGLSLSF